MRLPRWGLVLRALWWRRGVTCAVLAVAVVTTTAAALGPLYARAAGESILQDHLIAAGPKAGLHFHAETHISRRAYRRTSARVPVPGTLRGYSREIRGMYTDLGEFAVAPKHGAVQTGLVWRQGACRHLVIVQGRCPHAPNEAIASQAAVDSPRGYGWKLGVRLRLSPKLPPGFTSPPAPPPVHVVGVYRPKDTADPFWFDQPYFVAGLGGGQQDTPDLVAALFVTKSEFLSLDPRTVVETDFDYPLTPNAIRLDTTDAARATATDVLNRFPGKTSEPNDFSALPTTSLTATTRLPEVLASAARERHLAEVGTLLVTVQLALLAWLVLFQIISDAIEARGNEIAMAKLRGLSPAGTVRFGLGEPVLLLAAAVPLGLVAALGVTRLFAASVLVPGVPVLLPASAVGTALIAFAGGLLAAALAGYRTLTRPVLEQWRRTQRAPGSGRLALVADVLLAVAAVTGLILLRSLHGSANSSDTASLLAPGLLVAAVGILGVRLLPLTCRALAARTRATRRIGVFLASRQVARRPVGLRLAALLAVAVGLATFAVAGETVATSNRSDRARTELGAAQIATVQFGGRTDPVTATVRADPTGRWAMAAATWLPDGGDSVIGTVLGLDASRLAAVSYPATGGPSATRLAHVIGHAPVPPITTNTTALRVHLTATGVTGRRPYLTVNLRKPGNRFYSVDSRTIAAGRHVYRVPVKCHAGCMLAGLIWNRPIDATAAERGRITLTGIDVRRGTGWRALDIGREVSGSWRSAVPAGQASDHVTVTRAGIVDHFTNRNGGYGGIAYDNPPSPMPAVATPHGVITGSASAVRRPQVIDYSQTTAYFHIQQYAHVLPAVLADGVVMDVRYLDAELPSFRIEAQWQVWLGPHAPADALARLAKAGLHVEHVRSEAARVAQLGRQGPALALLLLLACAVAGAVLAIGGTAISISASSRRRGYEIAALRAVGIHRGSLRRASIVEQLLLLGGAAVLGIPTGLIAARLAMPVIPEFADHTPVALTYTPHWAPTLLFAAAILALLTATAIVAAYALIHVAVPARLREAEA